MLTEVIEGSESAWERAAGAVSLALGALLRAPAAAEGEVLAAKVSQATLSMKPLVLGIGKGNARLTRAWRSTAAQKVEGAGSAWLRYWISSPSF